jgi:threonine/homoserine/homoserine lactone efflux protein
MDSRFLAFVTVSALLIVAPGPDMALVARNALRSGFGFACATALGVAAGILGWGVAAVVGVATLLAQSADAFALVKLVGAAYLLYLGLRSLRDGLARSRHERLAASTAFAPRRRIAFQQGLWGNLLNPKAAVIFVTVIPQFIKPGDAPIRFALMLLVFEAMLIGWLTLYSFLLCRAGQSRMGRRLRRGLQTVSGLVLVGFGLRLATERQ